MRKAPTVIAWTGRRQTRWPSFVKVPTWGWSNVCGPCSSTRFPPGLVVRGFAGQVRLDFHYGRDQEAPPVPDPTKPRPKGAKLSGVQGRGKTTRWYKQASVAERQDLGGWTPLLDGRLVLTPREHPLVVPSEHQALMVAAEWEMQHPHIQPDTMPITRLATTTMDRLIEGKAEVRHALILELLEYIETDTICYRPLDKEKEKTLYEKQQSQLRPLLKWFDSYFNMPLMLHYGVIPEQQPNETINGLRLLLHNTTDWELGCLDTLVSRTKSLVLGLALWKGPFSVEQCISASRIEEEHNITEWGECEGAHDLDRVDAFKYISAATAFIRTIPLSQASLK